MIVFNLFTFSSIYSHTISILSTCSVTVSTKHLIRQARGCTTTLVIVTYKQNTYLNVHLNTCFIITSLFSFFTTHGNDFY